MTTEAQTTANRLNAGRSTGPRTAEGKARASRNARRHGLSIPVLEDPETRAAVDRLANEIVQRLGDAGQARAIAQAEVQLDRVRAVRDAVWAEIAQMGVTPVDQRDAAGALAIDNFTTVINRLADLNRLERYERRAMARLKKAVKSPGP